MRNFMLMFAENTELQSDFWTAALPIIRTVLLSIIVICCLVMIVTTLLQSSANQAGSSAITGGSTESYFSQNRDNSRDGRLKRTTIWMSSIIAITIVVYFVISYII